METVEVTLTELNGIELVLSANYLEELYQIWLQSIRCHLSN